MVLQPSANRLKAADIRCTSAVLDGDVALTIAAYAAREDFDMIVMSDRGMRALANGMTGSVATKVVGLTDVPVTSIH